ncbi:cation-translocating P-type ATPase, partial [Candidatus Pacearchaeota archaeon]
KKEGVHPYALSVKEVLNFYRVSPEKGLSEEQVKSRLAIYGENKLKEQEKLSPWKILIEQFKSFIIYILLFAVVVSFIVGEFLDASMILAILVINAVLGFVQEYKAERSIEALKKMAALKARVVRNGRVQTIATEQIVPGDIILLEEGTKIPADARLIEAVSLAVQESALTGESVPVEKHTLALRDNTPLAERKNMVYAGTMVVRGRGKAVVCATGLESEIGKISGMLSETTKELTPLQKKLNSLGKALGMITLAIALVIFLVGLIKTKVYTYLFSLDFKNFFIGVKDWLLTSIALAVAAVPEGLPAVVTITLAIGVRRMLKRRALIRKLPSVETLGETSVICTDKTGTLTKNEMTVRKVFSNGKFAELTGKGYQTQGKLVSEKKFSDKDKLVFVIGALCNNATLSEKSNSSSNEATSPEVSGDPTEIALLVSALKAGFSLNDLAQNFQRLKEEPFDSTRKMMSCLFKDKRKGNYIIFTKGAPERVLEKCEFYLDKGKLKKLDKKAREKILEVNDKFASEALRVLGFAYKERSTPKLEERGLVFVGLQGMIDPPNEMVKESIAKCKSAGIRVVMVTGDNKLTAKAIAREVGIDGDAIDGQEFDALSTEEKKKLVNQIGVFARVEPKHKLEIVELLRAQGDVVAMTGDGVNDAPAIKKSDLGIAMGLTGTDVTKEASDMVILDNNFVSIVNAVEEGRGILVNIKKFINYLLSSNIAEVLVIFLAIIIGWHLPLTAIMLLWLNLVTDGLPALALGLDPTPKEVMRQPPEKSSNILGKKLMFNISYMAALITIVVLGVYYWSIRFYSHLPKELFVARTQTIAFTALVTSEFIRLQTIRSDYKLGILTNKYLLLALASSLVLQLFAIYSPFNSFFGAVPISALDWAVIAGASSLIIIANFFLLSLRKNAQQIR